MTPEQRQRAGRAVADRIAEMAATPSSVARAAGVHVKTVRSAIRGDHWPTDAVQSLVETVLQWPEGELAMRAVMGHAERALDAYSDLELAAELTRRIEARGRRDAQLRATAARRERRGLPGFAR